MKVIPNYRRYEPRFGFKPAPDSGVVCVFCGGDIARDDLICSAGGFCHLSCLAERGECLD